ncbi:hypothetical protein ACWCXL_12285 [Streptomyces sp. NPDC001588]
MLGLTTTRHLRAVTAGLEARLTTAYLSAELDRRRLERARARERANLRHRLERVVKAHATARKEQARSAGALRVVSELVVDQHSGAAAAPPGAL